MPPFSLTTTLPFTSSLATLVPFLSFPSTTHSSFSFDLDNLATVVRVTLQEAKKMFAQEVKISNPQGDVRVAGPLSLKPPSLLCFSHSLIYVPSLPVSIPSFNNLFKPHISPFNLASCHFPHHTTCHPCQMPCSWRSRMTGFSKFTCMSAAYSQFCVIPLCFQPCMILVPSCI